MSSEHREYWLRNTVVPLELVAWRICTVLIKESSHCQHPTNVPNYRDMVYREYSQWGRGEELEFPLTYMAFMVQSRPIARARREILLRLVYINGINRGALNSRGELLKFIVFTLQDFNTEFTYYANFTLQLFIVDKVISCLLMFNCILICFLFRKAGKHFELI